MTFRIPGGALALPFLLCAAPAWADHGGPEAGGTAGGALDVAGPETLGQGDVALSLRSAFAIPQDRSDGELIALAAAGVHAHTSDGVLTTRLGAALGVTERFTVSASLPFIARPHLREGEDGAVVPLGSPAGFGDLTLLGKYRLTPEAAGGIALIAGLKLPTGRTHLASPEGERLETEHQPGTGSWDPILGVAAGTAIGANRIDASVLYQFAGTGAQATRLGDRLQAGIGIAHRFAPAAGHHHDESDESAPHHHDHPSFDLFAGLTFEDEGRQWVGGEIEAASGGKALWLSPGARYVTAGGIALAGSLGVPLWQDIGASHPGNRLRLTLAIAKAL